MLYGRVSSRDIKLRMFLLALTLTFVGALLPACSKSDTAAPTAQQNAAGTATAGAPAGPRPTDPKTALEALMQGNERYASGKFAADVSCHSTSQPVASARMEKYAARMLNRCSAVMSRFNQRAS